MNDSQRAELWHLARNGDKPKFEELFPKYGGDKNLVETTYKYYRGTSDKKDILSKSITNTSSNSNSNFLGSNDRGIIGRLNKIGSGVANISSELYKSQITNIQEDSDAFLNVLDVIKKGGLNPLKITSELISKSGKLILDQLKSETQLRYDINSQTSLTGELSESLRNDMVQASIKTREFGYGLKDVSELYTNLVSQSGKLALINEESIVKISPVARVLNMTLAEFASTVGEFEKVGIGLNDTTKFLDQITPKSLSLGLSSSKVSKDLKDNVGRLNEYGFKNGVQGLERMVQKSNEFRMSMDSVFAIADKVFTPESALDLAANLQVLGGAIGDFNDPLRLMYMATNNVEGLQDALIGAAGGLATYNQEQGRFEVTGINLRRAKEMAHEFGISMGELNKIAISAAERSSASAEMFAKGLNVTDEDREFLTNLSRMKDGKMVIEIPESLAKTIGKPTEIAMEKLDQSTANQLLENRKAFKEMDSKTIAMEQLTELGKIARSGEVVAAYYTVRAAQTLKGVVKESYEELARKNLEKILEDQRKLIDSNLKAQPSIEDKVKEKTRATIESIKEGNLLEKGKNLWNTVAGTQTIPQIIEKKVTYRHEFVADNVLDKVRVQSIQNSAMGIAFNDGDEDDMKQYEKSSKAERIYI